MKTPSKFVQCAACLYHWAWVVSPKFCPSCAHEHFTDWTPPPPAAPDPRRTATTYDMIFLADNEWGNQLMREVANEWFITHADCNFVHVYEHAGWALTFARQPQCPTGMDIVTSANDQAKMRPDRPLPTHYSGIQHRREVTRHDIHEIESLAEYATPVRPTLAVQHFIAEMAHELNVSMEELTS